MLLIVGTIRLPADGLAAALPAMRAMVQASRAEPGCIEYAYAQDVLDAGLIHVHELWRSRTTWTGTSPVPTLRSGALCGRRWASAGATCAPMRWVRPARCERFGGRRVSDGA